MRVANASKGTVLAANAQLAQGFWARLVGLLDRKSLSPGEGLVLVPCSGVHTCFMRFPIDVAFLDRQRRVVKVLPNMRAFRFSPIVRLSALVIELPAGTLERTGTEAGDHLEME